MGVALQRRSPKVHRAGFIPRERQGGARSVGAVRERLVPVRSVKALTPGPTPGPSPGRGGSGSWKVEVRR